MAMNWNPYQQLQQRQQNPWGLPSLFGGQGGLGGGGYGMPPQTQGFGGMGGGQMGGMPPMPQGQQQFPQMPQQGGGMLGDQFFGGSQSPPRGAPQTGMPPTGALQAPTGAPDRAPPSTRLLSSQITPSATPPPGYTAADLPSGYQWGKAPDGSWVMYNAHTVSGIPSTVGGSTSTTPTTATGTNTAASAGGLFGNSSPLNDPQTAIIQYLTSKGLNPNASMAGQMLVRRARDLMYSLMGRMMGSTGYANDNPGLGVFGDENAFRSALQGAVDAALRGENVFGSSNPRDTASTGYTSMVNAPGGSGGGLLAQYFADPDAGPGRAAALWGAMNYGGASDFYRGMYNQQLATAGPQFEAFQREHPGQEAGGYANMLGWLLNQGRQYVY